MKYIDLDKEDEHVKQFLSSLADEPDETMLCLNGQPLLKVLPPSGISDAEKRALIEERRALMRRARERVKDVPAATIERDLQDAVDEVRRRKQHQ